MAVIVAGLSQQGVREEEGVQTNCAAASQEVVNETRRERLRARECERERKRESEKERERERERARESVGQEKEKKNNNPKKNTYTKYNR